jgi:uncharacterized protein (TIGR03118 family)
MSRSLARAATLMAGCALVVSLAGYAYAAFGANSYNVRFLVSDGTTAAENTDANLVNAWGIASNAAGVWWVADNKTDLATLYAGNGFPQALVVSVPGGPTGIVSYGGPGFLVTDGAVSAPARFLFAKENGTIAGWSPGVPPPAPSRQTFVVADRSAAGARYKGLAVATTAAGDFLYAADFHNGRVDVFDGAFRLVGAQGAFVDPDLPPGFAPFGVQTLQGKVFVTYARQDEEAKDEVTGPGLGFVSVFDTAGTFLARVASGEPLNAPWGVSIAPVGFGRFSGNLLVGNLGDGRINAFDLATFEARGHLKRPDRKPIVIDGLRGLGFGNGAGASPTDTLFFAAGPNDETQGLFGSIRLE